MTRTIDVIITQRAPALQFALKISKSIFDIYQVTIVFPQSRKQYNLSKIDNEKISNE